MEKGKFLGGDRDGHDVFVGSIVDHTSEAHAQMKGGTVTGDSGTYKGEAAVLVDYPNHEGWRNRLSKLLVLHPTTKPASQNGVVGGDSMGTTGAELADAISQGFTPFTVVLPPNASIHMERLEDGQIEIEVCF